MISMVRFFLFSAVIFSSVAAVVPANEGVVITVFSLYT